MSSQTGTSYSLSGNGGAGLSLGDINLTGGYSYQTTIPRELPNKKVTIHVHQATGGYIVEVANKDYSREGALYIVSEDKDLGEEIGKIITHAMLVTE